MILIDDIMLRMNNRQNHKKIILQVDLVGPIMADTLVENLRATRALPAAKRSGVFNKIIKNSEKIDPKISFMIKDVSVEKFVSFYKSGKASLKSTAGGAEAYNDINRIAATLLEYVKANEPNLATGLSYVALIEGISRNLKRLFIQAISKQIKEGAEKSIDEKTLDTIANIITTHPSIFDIITDNDPDLFRAAFGPALVTRIKKYNENSGKKRLPIPRYMRYPENKLNVLKSLMCESGFFVSGEGWGNEKRAETWDKIFKARGIVENMDENGKERVFFVDDSRNKLNGFIEAANARKDKFRFVPVHFNTEEKKDYPVIYGTAGTYNKDFPVPYGLRVIYNIEQLILVVDHEVGP